MQDKIVFAILTITFRQQPEIVGLELRGTLNGPR